MTDIVPELLENILGEFERLTGTDQRIAEVLKKIRSGKATYADVYAYAERIGGHTATALLENITAEILPDGVMYFNIADRTVRPILKQDYELIAEAAREVQENLNSAAGIGMNAVKPEMNEDRISGIVDKLTEDGKSFEEVKHMLGDPVTNFCQSVVDDSVRKNAEFHYQSGMQPVIKRMRLGSKKCRFCEEREGTFRYPLKDNNIYQRHENCKCVVLYDPGNGKYQDVHSKIEYKSVREAAKVRQEELRQENEDKFMKKKNLARAKGEKFVDATEYWNNKPKEYPAKVVDAPKKFTYKGVEYEQDGVHIFIDDDADAERIRQMLKLKYGGKIERFPQIQEIDKFHPAQQAPDMMWNGIPYDVKTFERTTKNNECIYNAINKKEKQAHRFILDITELAMEENAIIENTKIVFGRKKWVEQIILVKKDEVFKVFEKP